MCYGRIIALLGFLLALGCVSFSGCRNNDDQNQGKPQPKEGASAPVTKPTSPGKVTGKKRARPAVSKCARVCNHQQRCGQSRSGVADCMTACLEVLKEDNDRNVLPEAGVLRARSKCADVPCADIPKCVTIALVGKERVAASKPVADAKAKAMCLALCDKQKTCDQAAFARQTGGMRGCLGKCRHVLQGTSEGMAAARIAMEAAYACRSESCQTFEQCRKKRVIGR